MSDSPVAEVRIAVDAMGGDKGPAEVAAGIALALAREPTIAGITVVGHPDVLPQALAAAGLASDPRIALAPASEVIEMGDKPLQAIKRKRDASMVRAIELVKSGGAGAALSCGNTGALMALGTLRLRPVDGLERPALATVMPNGRSHFILIDAGANPDAKPEHLVHNAVLGSAYARAVLNLPTPRVGLLTIGTEEGKGNELIAAAHELLKRAGPVIHYHGLIEGFQVFEDEVDVVVCDGFTGNVVLKCCEGLFHQLRDFLKRELTANPIRQAGALLARGAFRQMRATFSPDRYGGAPLLGLRGHVLKSHGSANREAIASALGIATRLLATGVTTTISRDLATVADALAAPTPQATTHA